MAEKQKKLSDVCGSPALLYEYLRNKAEGHNCYKVYSTFERLRYWEKTRSIYLSTGRHWNDTKDRNNFNFYQSDCVNFGLCFSFSRSESIAMWMLYGGMNHHGIMVDFKKSQIHEIISQQDVIEFGYWEDNRFVKIMSIPSNELNIEIVDVLYVSADENKVSCDIKRSEELCKDIPRSIVNELDGVQKSFPWNYENECRLIVRVQREKMNSNITTARIQVGNMYEVLKKEQRIVTAPNNKSNPEYRRSRLFGNIDWDLCARCSYKQTEKR